MTRRQDKICDERRLREALARERIQKRIEQHIRWGEEQLAAGTEMKTLDEVEDDLDEIREGYWHP